MHGTPTQNPQALFAALETMFTLTSRTAKLLMYASISSSVDTTDQEAVALQGKASALMSQVRAATAFIRPEILLLGQEKIHHWAAQEPRLAVYAHYFDNLFRLQAHVRTAEVEEVLGLVAAPFTTPRQSTTVLANAEMHFPPATNSHDEALPVAQSTIETLLASPDRDVRRTAWDHYADTYLAFKQTLAANLSGAIKQDVFYARARRYQSALEASLFPNHIPLSVFHNVIATFRRHLPTWHRYWALRRHALGYDALHTYDLKVSLTTHDPVVPFQQAVEWIAAGLEPLGEEYVRVLRRGCFEERWVDRYPNQGKRGGAFSSGRPDTHPFIVMSYNDTLKSMSTLAHELGHSMHSYLTWKTQPLVYSDYSLFVAETASNFHQAMVRAYLLKTYPDPDFQLALIDEAMSNFYRYFFIMPTLARFELEVHERMERGESPTADRLNGLLADLLAEGYGEEVVLDRERDGITWAQFNHLFSNFYVYQYTTGIAGANLLAGRILTGQAGAAEQYLDFLRTGDASYPLEALKRAGVDHTTPEPIEQTFGVLANLVDRLEGLTRER
jgi:oligoendopeptidase F